jgi:preprotein translocase subunit SecA
MLSKVIESSQHKVEQMHFDIRKQLLAYDNVMNHQREAVYSERRTLLHEENIVEYGWGIAEGVLRETLDRYFPEQDEPNPERAASRLRALFCFGKDEKLDMVARLDSRAGMELLQDEIVAFMKARYDAKISDLTAETANGLARYIVLNTLDDAWRDHLLGMDELRRGIGLRAIGQKDPLLEYQFESFNLFQEMMQRVRESFVEQFFRVRVVSEGASLQRRGSRLSEGPRRSEGLELPARGLFAGERSASSRFEDSLPLPAAGEGRPEPVRKGVRIGRNDLCPCGSGKKYKHCCGKSL